MLYTKFQGHRPVSSVQQKKIFKGFLSYMGMAATLVIWPGPFEKTFVPSSYGDTTWNLALTGPMVLEKMFEECGRWMLKEDGQWRQACLHYKLIHEPKGWGELKSNAAVQLLYFTKLTWRHFKTVTWRHFKTTIFSNSRWYCFPFWLLFFKPEYQKSCNTHPWPKQTFFLQANLTFI